MPESIKVDGVSKLDSKIHSVQIALTNFEPIWPEVAKEWHIIEATHFITAGKGNWKALSPATIAKSGPHPILVESGKLLQSLTTNTSEGAIYRPSRNKLVLGSNLRVGGWVLAAIHQFGAMAGRGRKVKIPKRKVISTVGLKPIVQKLIHRRILQVWGKKSRF